ncbi:MAG: recombinase family protein [Rhizonema sp. PD38]|nr:recombinase family protein [Rhizonema sp. PD38]
MLNSHPRFSTQDQNLALQYEALQKAGCEKIWEDKASSSRAERLGLQKAMEMLRAWDMLVAWKLDRFNAPALAYVVQRTHRLKNAA